MSPRDKEATRKKILRAVADLLQSGDDVGINRVAERAGVDKVLIYRYFGGLSGLLTAFAADGQVWPEFEEIMETAPSVAALLPPDEIGVRFVHGFLRELRERSLTHEIFRWELVDSNDLTRAAASVREARLAELIECREEGDRDEWVAACALITAGLLHLMLQAKSPERFCGLDLRSPDTWEKLERAATRMIQSK